MSTAKRQNNALQNSLTPGTSSNMRAALRGVEYIAQHIKNQDKDNEVSTHSFFACLLIFFYKKPKNQPNKCFLV
jgi:hypothetical protein